MTHSDMLWRRFVMSWLFCAMPALGLAAGVAPPQQEDLEDLQALLNQPVYAASKFAQDAADAPAAVSVLTSGDIRANGWRTLAEVLNGVRGVYLRYDRNYQYVGVRGFARPGDYSSRLLVLIDGMRVNDNLYDQAGVGREFPLDVALIERVEFVPGPGSALYGSNAVLGTVNIVTKSLDSLRGGKAVVELGSSGSRLFSVSQGLEWGGGRLLLAAKQEVRPGRDHYYAEFDEAATNFGVSPRADEETDRKLYAKWTHGEFAAFALYSKRGKQLPTGAFDTAFPSQDTRGSDQYAFADLQWRRALGAKSTAFLRATLAQYDYSSGFDYGAGGGVLHLHQRGRWVGLEARWQYEGWQGQRWMLGLETQNNLMQRQRALFEDNPAEPVANIDSTSKRWGLFANDEITLPANLHLVLGLRLDQLLNGDHSTTPRLALLWDAAPGLVVKLLDGRAYREPNAYESQYRDNTTLANPALQRETLRASELAVDWRALANLRLAASLYRYKVANLIEQQPDAASNALIFNNVGAANAQGLELEADYVGSSGWRLRGSWSAQHTRNDDGSGQISNSPTTLAKLNFSLPLAAWQSRLGMEWQWVGPRLTVTGARLVPHAVTNLTYQFLPLGWPLSLSTSVYNLFNKSYADPGGPELRQDSLAQDGRQWRLQLALQF